jgi:hypothetical protein
MNTIVRLIALRDPLGSPYFTTYDLTVPNYLPPEWPPQQGTSERPITFDARFWSVAYRNGSLWAVHHVDDTRVRARWYEIAMNGWPESGSDPTLVQSGEIDPGSPVRTYFPSIMVDSQNNAVITTARSSASEYISMCWTYRMATDPSGQFRPLRFVKQSSAPYAGNRWGDYSGTAVEPGHARKFWGHHEYTPGSSSWNTWIAEYTTDLCRDKGDTDGDCSLDLADWVDFPACVAGPTGLVGGDCTCYDFDGNNRVDLRDYGEFQRQITGSGGAIPGCLP